MLSICLVEDKPTIRARVAKGLASLEGVELLGVFEDGESAYEQIPKLNPQLVISDIGLPGISGTQLLARLVKDGFAGDVVMFTVFDDDDNLFGALELGAIGYILKEDGLGGIKRALDDYRNEGAPMSHAIARRVLRSFRKPAAAGLSAKLEELTPQQLTILELLADGLLNKQIASKLYISESTVKQHNHRIYRTLAVNNRAEAIRLYLVKSQSAPRV